MQNNNKYTTDFVKRKIDKFYVFYGAPGTGKSTMLNIVDKPIIQYIV